MEENKTLIASAAAVLVLSALIFKVSKQSDDIAQLKFELC